MTDPKPDHPWNGTDDGHNCANCPPESIWRCDVASHEWDGQDPMALLSSAERTQLHDDLDAMAKQRRQATVESWPLPLELVTALFGEDPGWPTPSVGDGPAPFDISNVGAW